MRNLIITILILLSGWTLQAQIDDTCALLRNNGSDEINKVVKVTYPDLIFEHTPDGYKSFNTTHAFVESWVSMGRIGKIVSLFLDFKIWSPNAEKMYGKLPKGSQVEFQFESGEILTLRNDGKSKPEISKNERSTVYKCYFVLSPYFFDKLNSEYLRKITIKFSKKRETFEVMNPYKIRLQVPCLGFGEEGMQL